MTYFGHYVWDESVSDNADGKMLEKNIKPMLRLIVEWYLYIPLQRVKGTLKVPAQKFGSPLRHRPCPHRSSSRYLIRTKVVYVISLHATCVGT